MKKNTSKTRTPNKTTIKKSNSLMNKESTIFTIGNFTLGDLGVFSFTSFYKRLALMACSFAVVITLLCQLRAMRPESPSRSVDITPAFKFYKNKIITSDIGHATCLMVASKDCVVHMDEDPVAMESQLIELLDASQGSSKYIKTPTANNWVLYIYGATSRMLGLANSCPSTNYKVFGIGNPLDLSVQKILDMINIPNKPSKEEVVEFLKEKLTNESNDAPSFEEPGFQNGEKAAPLEIEIFGENNLPKRSITIRPRAVALGIDGTIPDNAISKEDLVKYLTPIERVRYEQAAKAGIKNILTSLNERIIRKIEQESVSSNDSLSLDQVKVESNETLSSQTDYMSVDSPVIPPKTSISLSTPQNKSVQHNQKNKLVSSSLTVLDVLPPQPSKQSTEKLPSPEE